LTGVAVKVTDVPAHIAPTGDATMLTLAVRTGLTVIVIVFDVAGLPARHGVAVEVITTEITLPLVRPVEVYVDPVCPAIGDAPFIH
jgi:hypothetical protein